MTPCVRPARTADARGRVVAGAAQWPADREAPITFVVIPEFVARTWWERILYNQSARRLRQALLGRRHTVVVNVPYRREEATAPEPKGPGP